MTIRLYFAPGACSFVPHVALETITAATGTSVEYQLVKLHKGEHRAPEFLAMNPDGQVPVLQVDDRPLAQIMAICGYLDARFPEVGLLPTDPWARAQTLSMMAWINNTVHPTFAQFFMPHKFVDDAQAQATLRGFAAATYRTHLERIQGWLGCAQPWLGGARPSFIDAYVLTLLRWGGHAGIDPDTLPAYRDYVARLAQEPAVAAALSRERIELNTFKPATA